MKRQDTNTADDGQISELLNKNLLNRNENMYALINFINGIEGQMILNIDGVWGTGKSVFLRQLEYVSSTEDYISNQSSANELIVNKFKKDYFVFYFNSWEHDLYNNPMESLISELLMKIASEIDLETEISTVKDEMKGRLKKAGGKFLNRVIKKITADLIDLEDFTESKEDSTPEITSIRSQKEAVNSLLQELSSITDKRILIIVDELDRCKPSYAVELLEIVKHFFTHDDVIFLFGTNKSELEHTIKSLYGQGFNGYKYLNRFFDFEFSLPSIDNMYYLSNKYKELSKSYITDIIKYSIDNFELSMRDVERLYVLMKTIDRNLRFNTEDNKFISFVIVVYALSLKISKGDGYKKFVVGNGKEDFLKFCKGCLNIIEAIYFSLNEDKILEKINTIYDMYPNFPNDSDDEKGRTSQYLKSTMELLNMLNM